MSNDYYFVNTGPPERQRLVFTAIILISFIVGALFMQYVLPTMTGGNGSTSLNDNRTATPSPGGTPYKPGAHR
jgi:hypothetical protein